MEGERKVEEDRLYIFMSGRAGGIPIKLEHESVQQSRRLHSPSRQRRHCNIKSYSKASLPVTLLNAPLA